MKCLGRNGIVFGAVLSVSVLTFADGDTAVNGLSGEKSAEQEKSATDSNLVSANFGMAFDSKFMSYGLVDNNDPIVTPSAEIVLFDWVSLGVEALFDTTKYGKKHGGYSNRGGKYIELDPSAGLKHSFSAEDFRWLPTTLELGLGYSYEYHPKAMGHGTGEAGDATQFITFEAALPDLPLEPKFAVERDIDRDNGTYLNLELGHAFALIESMKEDEDPLLGFRLSVAQGFGNGQRVKGYLSRADDEALNHAGLMDTCVKGELAWRILDNVTLSGYVAYYDFLFDSAIRDAARRYEASGRHDTSYSFVAGLTLSVSFGL